MAGNTHFTMEVVQDPEPQSPREWSNVGTVVLGNRCRYNFGDKRMSMEEIHEILANKNHIILPVYMYDHSGITINTTGFSCPWDSGQVGIIYCTKEQAVSEWGKKKCTKKVREAALNYMKGEIETLDQFLTGDVYGYEVKDAEGDVVDSCWGFYDRDEAKKEGENARLYREENQQKTGT